MTTWLPLPAPLQCKDPQLIVLGASGRSTAEMAAREGLLPWVADRFRDWDLARWCPGVQVNPYPAALVRLSQQFPQVPWLYTGAMENRPRLLEQLARRRPLAGNPPQVLARVRNPWWLARVLRQAGLPAPEVFPQGEAPPRDGRWLLKPLGSAGGWGVKPWEAQSPTRYDPHRHYFQRRVQGEPLSVLFLSWQEECHLLACHGQWCGRAWAGAGGFVYCGSWGPLPADPELARQLKHLGTTLTLAAGLRGLWGADGVLTPGGFVPVEINPRVPASAEVLHLAREAPLLGWHLAACGLPPAGVDWPPRLHCRPPAQQPLVAKAVLYAREACRVSRALPQRLLALEETSIPGLPPQVRAACRDVPHPGSVLRNGEPVLTLLLAAPGDTGPELESLMARAAQWVYDQLEPVPLRAGASPRL